MISWGKIKAGCNRGHPFVVSHLIGFLWLTALSGREKKPTDHFNYDPVKVSKIVPKLKCKYLSGCCLSKKITVLL